jgi:hypothetical protein
LRDGAYLLPDSNVCREALASVEHDILSINGTAYILPVVDSQGERFAELFDRSDDYSKVRVEIEECREHLNPENALATTKQLLKLRKTYDQLTNIDYFPGKPKQQIDSALQDLETAVSTALSADEPHSRDLQAADSALERDMLGRISHYHSYTRAARCRR